MNPKTLLSILIALLLAGCLQSLHPLYTDKDLILDDNILGCWTDNGSTWIFEQSAKSKTYDLTLIMDKDRKGRFDARLVKIDQMLFLDLYPQDPGLKQNEYYQMHLQPVHSFIRIDQTDQNLIMAMIENDKIDKMLKSDPNLIKHECLEDGRIFLTASTEELQAFMKKYAPGDAIFGQPNVLKPCEPNEPNQPNEPNKP